MRVWNLFHRGLNTLHDVSMTNTYAALVILVIVLIVLIVVVS